MKEGFIVSQKQGLFCYTMSQTVQYQGELTIVSEILNDFSETVNEKKDYAESKEQCGDKEQEGFV